MIGLSAPFPPFPPPRRSPRVSFKNELWWAILFICRLKLEPRVEMSLQTQINLICYCMSAIFADV